MDRANLKPQESVFILGAAGGVGSASIQIAKAAQARVIAGVSTPDKAQACLDMGADDVVVYGQHSIKDALKRLTHGQGVDVVLDPVGGPYAEESFRCMAWRGRYLVVGFAQGQIPAPPLNLPLLKGASIVGVFWGDFVRREPAAFQRDLAALYELYHRGQLKPVIDSRRPMSALPSAYERMASRQVVGKLLLVNESS
jgi:NADPH2:quinone reductase